MKRIKLLSLVLALCVLFMGLSNSYAMETKELVSKSKSNLIDEYLLDAGYPQDIIEILCKDTKLEFFEGKYRYQTSEEIYGVFTESYQIEYTLDDNGKILIDNENLAQFNKLLKTTTAVSKILHDKESSVYFNTLNKVTNNDVNEINSTRIDEPLTGDMEDATYKTSNYQKSPNNNISSIKSLQQDASFVALATLSNFKGTVLVSHISQSND